jgi:hypothetical protein
LTLCRYGSLKTAATKLLLILHLSLVFEELTTLPQAYNGDPVVCESVAFLHYYFGLANTIAVGFLVVSYRYHFVEDSWNVVTFMFNHAVPFILLFSLVTLLPFMSGSYDTDNGVWCTMATGSKMTNFWALAVFFFWVWCILLFSTAVLLITMYQVYSVDPEVGYSLFSTTGLYAIISILAWVPRTAIRFSTGSFEDLNDLTFVYAYLPVNIAGMLYTLVFLREKNALLLFDKWADWTGDDGPGGGSGGGGGDNSNSNNYSWLPIQSVMGDGDSLGNNSSSGGGGSGGVGFASNSGGSYAVAAGAVAGAGSSGSGGVSSSSRNGGSGGGPYMDSEGYLRKGRSMSFSWEAGPRHSVRVVNGVASSTGGGGSSRNSSRQSSSDLATVSLLRADRLGDGAAAAVAAPAAIVFSPTAASGGGGASGGMFGGGLGMRVSLGGGSAKRESSGSSHRPKMRGSSHHRDQQSSHPSTPTGAENRAVNNGLLSSGCSSNGGGSGGGGGSGYRPRSGTGASGTGTGTGTESAWNSSKASDVEDTDISHHSSDCLSDLYIS